MGCPLTDDQRQRLNDFKRLMHCERKANSAIKEIQSILNLRRDNGIDSHQKKFESAIKRYQRKTWEI